MSNKKNTDKKKKGRSSAKGRGKASNARKKNGKSKTDSLSFYVRHRNLLMLSYLLCALVMLCFAFIPGYNFWTKIRGAFYGFFGLGFVPFAVCILILGVKISLNSFKRGLAAGTLSAFSLSFVFSSLIHLFGNSIELGGAEEWKQQLLKAASDGFYISEKFMPTGGAAGAFVGGGLLHLLGKAGAFIVVFLLLALSIILFFGISFSSLGEAVSSGIGGGKARLDGGAAAVKEKNEEKRALRKIKSENKRQQKEEKRRLELEEKKRRLSERDDFDFAKSDIDTDFDGYSKLGGRRTPRVYKPQTRLFTDISDGDREIRAVERTEASKKSDEEEAKSEIETTPGIAAEFPDEIPEDAANERASVGLADGFSENEAPRDFDDLPDEAKNLVDAAINNAEAASRQNRSEVETYSDGPVFKREYSFPPIDCLQEPDFSRDDNFALEMKTTAKKLVDTLKNFNVETTLIGVSRGPSVTRYELQPAPGVKISKITNLADDIALNLASSGVRIEAPIPNKSAVGIEIPNKTRSVVTLREIISSSVFTKSKSKLNVALGKDISGTVVCADLAKMPHLLIAGTTGSGKSVCLNGMIASILYNAAPSEVKLLMVDPKQVEFSVYNGIPHLLVPVISDVRKAAGALSWAVGEMESRYKTFSACGVRDIKGFNNFVLDHPEHEPMPQIVVFIDELNDLMMVSPKEVEDSICRLAQKARAAGMHLVVATQRPSVDVITGIIKANIPSRLSLSVSSQVDSRTILDSVGAEKLLGNGDMLFNPIGVSKPLRIQGAYLSEDEIEKIVNFIKLQESAEYDSEVMEEIERKAVEDKKSSAAAAAGDGTDDSDDMLDRAIEVAVECEAASASLFQRKLRIGYARAARIMDQLDERGLIGPAESGGKPRKVLLTRSQYLEMKARADAPSESGNSSDNFDIFSD